MAEDLASALLKIDPHYEQLSKILFSYEEVINTVNSAQSTICNLQSSAKRATIAKLRDDVLDGVLYSNVLSNLRNVRLFFVGPSNFEIRTAALTAYVALMRDWINLVKDVRNSLSSSKDPLARKAQQYLTDSVLPYFPEFSLFFTHYI